MNKMTQALGGAAQSQTILWKQSDSTEKSICLSFDVEVLNSNPQKYFKGYMSIQTSFSNRHVRMSGIFIIDAWKSLKLI